MAPKSEISYTDVDHFKALANPDHIDLHASVEKVAKPGKNTLMSHSERHEAFDKSALNRIVEEDSESSSDGELVTPAARGGGRDYSSDSSSGSRMSRSSSRSRSSHSSSGRRHQDRHPDRHTDRHDAPREESPSKRDLLFELDQMVSTHGVTLSKHFSMHDSREEIESELVYHRQAVSDTGMLLIMREGLVAVTAGVEMANNRLGLLSLDGWSAEVAADTKRYDPALLRLKAKYLRHSTLSPEMELSFLLTSSAVGHHLKAKKRKNEAEIKREERKTRKEKKKARDVEDASSSSEDDELPEGFAE